MSLADEVRKDPLQYLPEVSLMAFWMFRAGYSFRCYAEGHPFEYGFNGRERQFELWVKARFGMPEDSHNVIHAIHSFACSEADAFRDYFALRDEFLSMPAVEPSAPRPAVHIEHVDLIQLLRKVRERPGMYFGTTDFRDFYLMMLGDERAFSDLGLTAEHDRKIWAEFKIWVEETKNRASARRSWHKIISYWGGRGEGGLELFYKWLDEFAAAIGQPELFQVPLTFWQRFRKS